MLDKDLYDSWKSRMELYMQNKDHGIMILESVKHGPLIWPTVEENLLLRKFKMIDMKATNIILQGLPADIYSLVNHHRVAKDLWERVQLLMQDSGFVVPVFSPGDDLIACLNKAMAFLTAIASSRFPSTNNQLRLPLIQEIKPLFKTAGLHCNKFRGDKGKIILVLRIGQCYEFNGKYYKWTGKSC
nr:hypothetical protein [Tanacetum cinerariifolium]